MDAMETPTDDDCIGEPVKDITSYYYPPDMWTIAQNGGDIGRRCKYLVASPPGKVMFEVMDNYKFGTECTITVKPFVMQHLTMLQIESQLMRYLDFTKTKYVFVRDWSKDGRYHLHGMLRFTDITKRTNIEKWVSKNIGRIEIKYISYNESYANYMVGQYDPHHEKYMDNLKWSWKNLFHDEFDYFYDIYKGK